MKAGQRRTPHPERDETVARILSGQATANGEARRLGLHKSTVRDWVANARKGRPAEERPPVERALEAAGELGTDAPPENGAPPEPAPADVKLTPDALVSLSELCISLPITSMARRADLSGPAIERLAHFDKDEREMLTVLAPAAIPSLEATLNKWPHAGLVIYGLALGVVAWSHLAALRKFVDASAPKPETTAASSAPPSVGVPPPAEAAA